MKKKFIIIIAIMSVVFIGIILALVLVLFKDGKEKTAPPPKVFQYELGKTMTYLASDKESRQKKPVYVQYSPVIFYTEESTLEVLTENKTVIVGEIEKYFNTKTVSKVTKMRGKNIEDDKDRIELDLEERISELLGDKGEKITRVTLLGFVIN